MRKIWIGILLVLALCCSGCVSPKQGGEAETDRESSSEQTSGQPGQTEEDGRQPEESTGSNFEPEFSNEAEDGWTKFY